MRPERYKTRFVGVIFGCMLSITLTSSLWSQSTYPTKPINILISFAPGGVVDIASRAIVAKAEKFLGQPFVIGNNGGGGGSVATAIVAKQKPDGYNLLACSSTTLIRIPHYRKVPYSLDNFVPIMQHATVADTGLAVLADSPFKTVKDLVEYARKNPGKVTYSSVGVGSPHHLAMEYIAKQEGITWTHVPYSGGMLTLTALLGGHVTASSCSTVYKPFVQEGRIRLLVTHGNERVKSFPNVPTMKELGYDFYNDTTVIVAAPKGTPMPIVKKLEDAFHKAFADQEYLHTLNKNDVVPAFRNSEDTKKFLEEAYKINGKWIAELKIPKETDQKK